MRDPRYDMIVVGGGINGAAIAREAALGGFAVLLLDQADIASGTTSASTRLIHGGLRYLEHLELGLVRESLAERERLLAFAPHLVEPLGIYIPVYADSRRRAWQIRVGLGLYDLLFRSRILPKHVMLSEAALRQRLPGLAVEGLQGGAFYFDAQLSFPERLVVEIVQDALRHGARLSTYTHVTRVLVEQGAVRGVAWRAADGTEGATHAPIVVNAAGPWVDRVLGDISAEPLVGGSKGSHIVVPPFEGAPSAAVYSEASSDGRPFFVIPWNGLYLIGTTDERYREDPGGANISDAELHYLCAETQRIFPGARDLAARVLYTQSGVRPLPHRPEGDVGAISRRHFVHRHRQARGLYSVIGGKLTTHRAIAEDVMRRLIEPSRLRKARNSTRERPLPGALPAVERDALLEEIAARIGPAQAQRLWRTYGGGARQVTDAAVDDPELAAELPGPIPVLVAELLHAVESEWATTLVDIMHRRCMAGLGPDWGLSAAAQAVEWLRRLGVWDRARAQQELSDYRAAAARAHASALSDGTASGPGVHARERP